MKNHSQVLIQLLGEIQQSVPRPLTPCHLVIKYSLERFPNHHSASTLLKGLDQLFRSILDSQNIDLPPIRLLNAIQIPEASLDTAGVRVHPAGNQQAPA